MQRERPGEREHSVVCDERVRAGVGRLEARGVLAVDVGVDDLLEEARAGGVRVPVNEADDVGLVGARLLARDLELDGLAGRDGEPVGVPVDRRFAELGHLRPPSDRQHDGGRSHA
jgi:hypothetical protein